MSRLLVSLSLVIFLILALYQVNLPGLYYDEALDLVPTLAIVQGQPFESLRDVAVVLGGRTFPLMVMDYLGTVNTYLALPLFALLGPTVLAVRLLPILIAALTLLLSYHLGRRLFDRTVGAVTVFLLAVHPSFVFWSRQGITVTSVMTVCSVGSLLALLAWWETRRGRYLALAGFLIGIGLWAKFLFLWWLVALVGIGGAIWVKEQRSRGEGKTPFVLRPSSFVLIGAGVIIGASPLLVFNLLTWGTLHTLLSNLQQTEYGVSNFNFLVNLGTMLHEFGVFLDGSSFWYLGETLRNPAGPVIFVLALLEIAFLVFYNQSLRGPVALVVALIGLILVQSSFTVSGLWATHLYILFPLPQMVIALALVYTGRLLAGQRQHRLWRQRLMLAIVVVAALGLPVWWGDLQVVRGYHQALALSGGFSRYSDSIYALADYLVQRGDPVVTLDWGMEKNLRLLTRNQVTITEITGYKNEPPEAFEHRLRAMFQIPGQVYLLHSKEDTVYERYPAFQKVAQEMGREIEIVEAFRDRGGNPVYVVWEAR